MAKFVTLGKGENARVIPIEEAPKQPPPQTSLFEIDDNQGQYGRLRDVVSNMASMTDEIMSEELTVRELFRDLESTFGSDSEDREAYLSLLDILTLLFKKEASVDTEIHNIVKNYNKAVNFNTIKQNKIDSTLKQGTTFLEFFAEMPQRHTAKGQRIMTLQKEINEKLEKMATMTQDIIDNGYSYADAERRGSDWQHIRKGPVIKYINKNKARDTGGN